MHSPQPQVADVPAGADIEAGAVPPVAAEPTRTPQELENDKIILLKFKDYVQYNLSSWRLSDRRREMLSEIQAIFNKQEYQLEGEEISHDQMNHRINTLVAHLLTVLPEKRESATSWGALWDYLTRYEITAPNLVKMSVDRFAKVRKWIADSGLQLPRVQAEIAQARAAERAARLAEAEARNEANARAAEFQNFTNQLAETVTVVEDLRRDLDNSRRECGDLRDQAALLQETSRLRGERVTELERELAALRNESAASSAVAQREINDKTAEIQRLRNEQAIFEQQLEEKNRELNEAQAREAKAIKELHAALVTGGEHKIQLSGAMREIGRLTREIARKEAEIESWKIAKEASEKAWKIFRIDAESKEAKLTQRLKELEVKITDRGDSRSAAAPKCVSDHEMEIIQDLKRERLMFKEQALVAARELEVINAKYQQKTLELNKLKFIERQLKLKIAKLESINASLQRVKDGPLQEEGESAFPAQLPFLSAITDAAETDYVFSANTYLPVRALVEGGIAEMKPEESKGDGQILVVAYQKKASGEVNPRHYRVADTVLNEIKRDARTVSLNINGTNQVCYVLKGRRYISDHGEIRPSSSPASTSCERS